jgi:hypothetical protein
LADIRLTRYLRRKAVNTFLSSDLPEEAEAESPFLDPRIVNISPESVNLYEMKAKVRKRDTYTCTNFHKSIIQDVCSLLIAIVTISMFFSRTNHNTI